MLASAILAKNHPAGLGPGTVALLRMWITFLPCRALDSYGLSLGIYPAFVDFVTRISWIFSFFDSCHGFPGEGWVFLQGWVSVFLLCAAMAFPAPMTPAHWRRQPLLLVADRVVRPATRSSRARLLQDFDSWLRSRRLGSLEDLLSRSFEEAEQIAQVLVHYGQDLFRSGAAYGRFSETINAVSAARPGIRRALSAAWDLAFAWQAEEPHAHHCLSTACTAFGGSGVRLRRRRGFGVASTTGGAPSSAE